MTDGFRTVTTRGVGFAPTATPPRKPFKVAYDDLGWAVEGVRSWEELPGFVAEVQTGNDDDMNLYRIVLRFRGREGLWGFDDGFAALAGVTLHDYQGTGEIEVYPVEEIQTVTYEREGAVQRG